MASIAQRIIREPGSQSVEQYATRVRRLALAYALLTVGSIVGIVLIVWKAQLFVSMSQRSNVETLTLAFFVVFFAYLGTISAPGAFGALKVAYYGLLVRMGRDRLDVERRKAATLGQVHSQPPTAALSAVVEKASAPGEPFSILIADEAGKDGTLAFDGAALSHVEEIGDGSNSLLAFVVHQINELREQRGESGDLEIVEWKSLDDESACQYLGIVRFAQNLERRLGADELWPKVRLTDEDCSELQRRLARLCPALRDEAFLPDWEYAAQHKLPIIPEPLGLVSLTRSERRADPIATMGCAVVVVLVVVAIIVLFILLPPWVPGA